MFYLENILAGGETGWYKLVLFDVFSWGENLRKSGTALAVLLFCACPKTRSILEYASDSNCTADIA